MCSLPILNYIIVAEKKLLKLVLETVNTPIAMMTSDMKINYANQATLDNFGYSKQQFLGRNIGMIMNDQVTQKKLLGKGVDIVINESKYTQYQATAETFRNTSY